MSLAATAAVLVSFRSCARLITSAASLSLCPQVPTLGLRQKFAAVAPLFVVTHEPQCCVEQVLIFDAEVLAVATTHLEFKGPGDWDASLISLL